MSQELLQLDSRVNGVTSSMIPVTTEEDATTLTAELNNARARIAELESFETLTVLWHKGFLEQARQRHSEEVGVRIETSAEKKDSLNNDVKVAKPESIKMGVVNNLKLAHNEEHVRALQTHDNVERERNVTFKDALMTVRDLLGSGRIINKSEYPVNIAKLTQEEVQLTGLL